MADSQPRTRQHNAFDILRKDHRPVEGLFEKIEAAGEDEKATKLFEQLAEEISLHAEIEEKLIYPRFEQARETQQLAEEAYKEHNQVKEAIAEIQSLAYSDKFKEKLKEMKKDQLDHIQRKKKNLPLGEKILSEDELYELGSEIMKIKQEKLEKKMA